MLTSKAVSGKSEKTSESHDLPSRDRGSGEHHIEPVEGSTSAEMIVARAKAETEAFMQGFRERNKQIERDFLSRPITAEKLTKACQSFRESLLELDSLLR